MPPPLILEKRGRCTERMTEEPRKSTLNNIVRTLGTLPDGLDGHRPMLVLCGGKTGTFLHTQLGDQINREHPMALYKNRVTAIIQLLP